MHIPLVLKYNFAFTALPFGSPNRCISDFAIALSKFLAPLGTLDMPRTLSEIAGDGLKEEEKYDERTYIS